MSRSLQDRSIRITNMNLITDHVKKLPNITGISNVSKAESVNDIDVINNSSGNGTNGNGTNGNGTSGNGTTNENGQTTRRIRINRNNIPEKEIIVTQPNNIIEVPNSQATIKPDDKKVKLEQKIGSERSRLEESNKILYQYRQELENSRMDVLRFHDAIQYTRLELLRLAKDKKIIEEEYKMNFADLTQARSTIEKTRLTCETTVLELRDRVQSEYELTRATSEELETLRRTEQEMLARDMRDSELVTQIYNLQLRNQALEEWFAQSKDKDVKIQRPSSVSLQESLNFVASNAMSFKPELLNPPVAEPILQATNSRPLETGSSQSSVVNMNIDSNVAKVEAVEQTIPKVEQQSPVCTTSSLHSTQYVQVLPSIPEYTEPSTVSVSEFSAPALPRLSVSPSNVVPNAAPTLNIASMSSSPRPSLTALLSPMIRSNAASLRSPAILGSHFSLTSASSPKMVASIELLALLQQANDQHSISNNKSSGSPSPVPEIKLSHDVIADILEKIREHSERSDALQLHLRAVCERCTESEDLLRMRDLHIDNLNQQVQLLSKTLEQKVAELIEKEQQYHEEVSKSSVAAFELSRLIDEKLQLETELHGEVAKNHELIYEVVPSCQKRAEEAELTLRTLQQDKQILIYGIKQVQEKYSTILSTNAQLEKSHSIISNQYDLSNKRIRGLEQLVDRLQRKLNTSSPIDIEPAIEDQKDQNDLDDSMCDINELRLRLQKSREHEAELQRELEIKQMQPIVLPPSEIKEDTIKSPESKNSPVIPPRAIGLRSSRGEIEESEESDQESSKDELSDVESPTNGDEFKGRGKYRRKSDKEALAVATKGKPGRKPKVFIDTKFSVKTTPVKEKNDARRASHRRRNSEIEDGADSDSSIQLGAKKAKKNVKVDAAQVVVTNNATNPKKHSHDFIMLDPIENLTTGASNPPDETILSYPINISTFIPANITIPNVPGRKYFSACMDDKGTIKPGEFVMVNQNKIQLIVRVIYLYEVGDQKLMRGRWYFKNDQTNRGQSNSGRREIFQVNRESDFLLVDILRPCDVNFPNPSNIDIKAAELQLLSGRDQYYCRQSLNFNTNEFEFLKNPRAR